MQLISIIIPIYNTEKYLPKCLDSIIAQTHTNWEAILIDDGSPDNCGKICDRYAAKDNRFKVIHQSNGGVSVARQTGLDNATGDYIIHCDPDDWIEPTMLEEMLDSTLSNNADMVICDFISHYHDHTNYESQRIENNSSARTVQRMILKGELHGSCCNKLVKKNVIKNISFFPSNILYCEDTLFNIKILNQNIKIVHVPKAFYHYFADNSTSICNSTNVKIILSRADAIIEIEKNIKDEERPCLYKMKKVVIDALFLTKNFEELLQTFPEIHNRIIKEHCKYHFFTPFGYFLARALRKRAKISYLLYKYNIWFINLIQKIRGRKRCEITYNHKIK